MTRDWLYVPRAAHSRWVSRLCRVPMAVLAVSAGACGDRSSEALSDVPEIELAALPLIGADAGQAEVGFGSIADLEIGSDGSLFVLDDMNRTILVFDEEGTLLRTFGGRGQGPGELERPSDLLWGPDGRLWVVDSRNGRYTVFEANGDLVATYRHTGPSPVFHPWAIGFSSDGLLYVVTSGPDLIRQEFWLVECEVADGEVRELQRFELPFVEHPSGFQHLGEGTTHVVQIPFSSAPVFGIGANGNLFYAATREPWVHRRSFPDGVEQRFGREFEPPVVSGAELDAVLEASRGIEELRTLAGSDVFAEFTSRIPTTRPHLDGFFFDDEENVWVMRAANADDDTRFMDVYDSSGTRIATARAALDPEPSPRVRDGVIAGVVRNELEVPAVALYRIRN